jgi:hypothetical protein
MNSIQLCVVVALQIFLVMAKNAILPKSIKGEKLGLIEIK